MVMEINGRQGRGEAASRKGKGKATVEAKGKAKDGANVK